MPGGHAALLLPLRQRPQRAAWQEFGDVIAEGLYTLLHLGLEVQQATHDYWAYFLEARRNFLEAIADASASAHPDDMRDEMLAVGAASTEMPAHDQA